MSDRRNRDVGRKRVRQQVRYRCDCWLCTDWKTKKRILLEKLDRKDRVRSMLTK